MKVVKNYKKVVFAGFFLNSDDKLDFTRIFDCENRLFLESSIKFAKYDTELIKFFPMNIFHMQYYRIWNLLFNRVELDSTFVGLYKRDLKIFKKAHMKDALPAGKKTYAFFVYWALKKAFKPKLSLKSLHNAFKIIISGGVPGNELGYIGEKDTYHQLAALKLFAFRFAFINGYIYIKKLVEKLDIDEGSLLVLWGSHNSGAQLLKRYMEQKGVRCLICEYGELPGTLALNKDGIFGDSEIAKNWDVIASKACTKQDITEVKNYLTNVESSQASSRGNSIDDQLLTLYRSTFEPKAHLKKIIYVSGVELIASGHLFNKEFVTPDMPNANEMLLRHVLLHFSSDEYTILYKDHPLMQNNYPELALNVADFKEVIFVNSMNVDNLISMAHLTVSLPSKVIMTCLMYKKPVYAYGDFSLPQTVPELGYYTGRNVAEVKQLVDDDTNKIDPELYPKIVHELQKYMIRIPSSLFDSYNFLAERQKLGDIIDSQLNGISVK